MNQSVFGAGGANVDVHGHSYAPIRLRDSNPGALHISLGGVCRNIGREGETMTVLSLAELKTADVDMFCTVFIGNEKFPELNKTLERLAEQYSVTPSAIAIAWILRHPAKIQAILGTTNVQRVKDICKASEIALTRMEWYELYKAAGNQLP